MKIEILTLSLILSDRDTITYKEVFYMSHGISLQNHTKEHMPGFFNFLTLLAFHVFIQEQVSKQKQIQ